MSDLALFGGSPIRTKPFPAWPQSNDAMKSQLISTLENESWGVGSKTIEEFNMSFAEFHDAKHCISVHSGTSALWVALKAAGVGAGDEVIIPGYTFIATATAVLMANAVPVFCDIELETVINFKKEMKVTYPLALDPNADIFGMFADKNSGVTRITSEKLTLF